MSRSKQMSGNANEQDKSTYNSVLQEVQPKQPIVKHALSAFVVGGAICLIGQLVLDFFSSFQSDMNMRVASTLTFMILLGAVATDIGIYDILGEISGMGAAVPITGFSNTIVAAALDFKREGWISGLGCKMLYIAGPVLIYGIVSGFFVGLIKSIALRLL